MKKTNTLILILTAAIVLSVANFLAAMHPARMDLTSGRIYTLADSTKKILKQLGDVVTVRLYFTKNMPPALANIRREVDDMLAEFKGAAGAKLQVEFIDPGESQAEEQKAMMLGIPPLQVNVVERDKEEVAKVFMGMVVMYGGKQEVLPVIRGMGNLEYDLAEAILKLSSKELPRLAWWDGGMKSGESEYGLVRDALGRRYDVIDVTEKTLSELDAKKIATLILVSPGKLSEDELFALDQYLMGGGRVMALVDRFDITRELSIAPRDTNVIDPLTHYGATVEDSLVADQVSAMAAFAGGVVTYQMPYPYWPDIRRDRMNQEQPIVSELETIVLPWTSPIAVKSSGDGAPSAALASTTQYAVAVPAEGIRIDPQTANEAFREGHRQSYDLVALLSGPFGSYFAQDKISPPKGRNFVREGSPDARIFVVGSSRWIADKFIGNFPTNVSLFENALDSFAMGDELIGIRSRRNTQRPTAETSDGMRAALKYANMAAGPLFLVVIGVAVYFFRRSRRNAVKLAYR